MLEEKLIHYTKTDAYPFHMPGHKRQLGSGDPYSMDITEIDGFDNLHSPKGVIKEAQQRAARLYGAGRSFFLVNGSTCGILAAVCAATEKGDRILVARNCHKAVYHAMELQELSPVYLYPEIAECGLQGQIRTEAVEKSLKENPDIRAVIITSPTYDGILSDVESIAETVHRRGIPLIVDEAHGAHLGFHDFFPANAVSLGADAVIVSVHKTLPAFTQTALLHLCSDRMDEKKIGRYLDIFETSSPSYILMAGIDRCIRIMEEDGTRLFREFARRLEEFYGHTGKLRRLHVLHREELLEQEAYGFDPSKIIIFTDRAGISGSRLQQILRERYRLETEMACGSYTLALTTIMDTQEGFDRLEHALLEIDGELAGRSARKLPADSLCPDACMYRPLETVFGISEALRRQKEEILPEDAAGRISGDYIYLYPPGIPLVVPGERMDGQLIEDVRRCRGMGLEVQGLTGEGKATVLL